MWPMLCREVTVYRLISRGTIEEGMYEMGQKKLQLEKNVMEAGTI
jgi:SNF2 family DNA or RNA helicase